MNQNVTVYYGSRSATLIQGWVGQPNGRGSIDILWSCAFTIFLSSWSVLCLNLPAEYEGWWKRAFRKFYWMLLTIMGPEIVFQLSLGQWLQARKWVQEFKNSGFEGWSMTHSFYANMGGFILNTPDRGQFPVNAAQLHFLLVRGHVDYPSIEKRRIQDKNKSEAVVRCLTFGQIVWFVVSCVARLQQGMVLTTIELSTLAFTFSAAGSFFCWYHKPMDVEIPDIVQLNVSIGSIHMEALKTLEDPWIRTPLDFIDREPEWAWNIYWQCGMAVLGRIADFLGVPSLVFRPRKQPIERFPDDYWPAPTFRSLPALFVFHAGYAAILVAGWKLELPTYVELILWRVSTLIQLGTIVSAFFTMPLMMRDAPQSLQRLFAFVNKGREKFKEKINEKSVEKAEQPERPERPELSVARTWSSSKTIIEEVVTRVESTRSMVNDDPNWRVSVRLLIVYQFTWFIYFTSRMYIIAEDIASMRALPASAYATVDWSEYFPHI